MKHLGLLILSLLVFCGCKNNDSKSKTATSDRTIDNVFDISNDTIIACKHGRGLILSKDGGKSWTELETSMLLDEVTLTDSGYLVGLDSWQGIHEPDYSRLFLSRDFGNSWKTFNLDTKKFFPLKIISEPKQKLLIETFDNKIYELTGMDLINDWTFIKDTSRLQNHYKEIESRFKIDASSDHAIKLLSETNNKIDTLATLVTCRQVNNVASLNDFVYISGAGYDKSFDETYAYFAVYNKTIGLKEYKIPGHYSYLKKTSHNNVYVMNDDGLFITNQDSLQKLY